MNPILQVFDNSNLTFSVLNYLSVPEVIAFESASKKRRDATHRIWVIFRQEDGINFNWSDCEKEPHKERWNYFLGRSLFIMKKVDVDSGKFNFLKRFPLFKSFLERDFSYQTTAASKEFAGDLLLEGIIESLKSGKYTEKAHLTLIQAIQKGATCSVILARKFYKKLRRKHLVSLAIESAKQKDYRILEEIGEEIPAKKIKKIITTNPGFVFPPLLYFFSKQLANVEERDRIIEDVLSQYNNKAPLFILLRIVTLKNSMKKFDQSEKLLEKYLNRKEPRTVSFFESIGTVKYSLKKFKEAEFFFAQALDLSKKEPSRKALIGYAFTKHALKKYEEAEKAFDFIFKRYKDQEAVQYIYIKATETKYLLNKYDEALKVLRNAKKMREPYTEDLCFAALLQLKRGRIIQAERLIDKAILNIGTDFPSESLLIAGKIKLIQKKYEEAEKLYILALERDMPFTSENALELSEIRQQLGMSD